MTSKYIVYSREMGETISYHATEALAIAKVKRLGYRAHTYKRIA